MHYHIYYHIYIIIMHYLQTLSVTIFSIIRKKYVKIFNLI